MRRLPSVAFRKKEEKRVCQNGEDAIIINPIAVITPPVAVTAPASKIGQPEREKPPVTGKPPDTPDAMFAAP